MSLKNLTLEEVWDKHHDCELVIYHKLFSNGRVVPGLYCKPYGTHIQWLDYRQADEYINDGTEVVLTKPKKKNGHPVKWLDPKDLGI